MYALISHAGDPTPRVEQIPPLELGHDEVRVAVAAAAFTYFDGFVATDHAALGLPDMIGLGFDFSGTVLEVGSAVTTFTVGDRVAGLHSDAAAPSRAHASEVIVPVGQLALVPEDLDLQTAAAAPLGALTARQALDLLGPERGRLLVTGGAGAVGGWAIALAKRDGWTVDALVRAGSEAYADTAGAETVRTDLPEQTYDAVLDAAALGAAALGAVRNGGRLVGVKPGRAVDAERSITVETVLVQPDGKALAGLLPLAGNGDVQIRVAATRPLTQAAELYLDAASAPGSDGRWLLIP